MDTDPQPIGPSATDSPQGNSTFLIVGIGASAGGVIALEQFFDNLAGDKPEMAFVVVMHLSPEHESHLAPLIQSHTGMPVVKVTKDVEVKPNNVYVIPPGKQLSMVGGRISLSEQEPTRGKRAPIDFFFRTLAESHGEWSAAVVLSGTGSDGSIGLTRVKEMGGITLVQDPAEAGHDQMPKSSIATGFVDYVLPVASMGESLIKYLENRRLIDLPLPVVESDENLSPPAHPVVKTDELQEILALLRTRTGHNFNSYKRSTLTRRVERRMQVNDLPDFPSYLDFLRSRPGEVQLLLRDLLISVTNFFRDKEVWDALEADIIPSIFRGKERNDGALRVWVAGCATGEEAYSLAILLHEYASTLPDPPALQIFATDLDERAIAVAREGSYPETIILDVSPDRLRRFFTHTGHRYRLMKEIRETVLFATHDLLKDPPFSRLDLISCRNLLIYLNRDAQEQLLTLFHFALRPHGYLLLGTSETADGLSQLYSSTDKEHHIFMRRTVPRYVQPIAILPAVGAVPETGRAPKVSDTVTRDTSVSFPNLHQNLLERYAPPSALIDQNFDIVHLSERAGRYLQITGGEPTHNLMRMVDPELRVDLRNALYRATKEGVSTETRRVRVTMDGEPRLVRLVVSPGQERATSGDGYILVIFDEVDETLEGSAPATQAGREDGAGDASFTQLSAHVTGQLEEEVRLLKGQLRSTVEQYETSVEELKASNEELQAINEELRSATEELETSREEMQAVNEELLTVNQELKIKVEEVSRGNSDLQNLIASTDIATIFLDRRMYVKRYTPGVEKLFNIIPTDTERPVSHITHKLQYNELVSDAESVLRDLNPQVREIHTTDGEWYMVRVLPYRTTEDKIDGVVITFVDITERKLATETLREREQRFGMVANLVPDLLWTSDPQGITDWYNQRWLEYTGRSLDHAQGYGWLEVVHPVDRERSRAAFQRSIATGEPLRQEYRIRRADGAYRWFLAQAQPLRDESGRIVQWIGAATDVEEQRTALNLLQISVQERTAELAEINKQLQPQIAAREQAEIDLNETNEQLRDLSNRLLEIQEEERRNIARELHDEIGQYLTGLKFLLEGLGSQGDEEKSIHLGAALAAVDDLTSRVRELSLNLRPSILDDLGLLPALFWYVQRYTAQTGVEVDLRHKGLESRLPPELETAIYRVVQEALTNVARHSGAREVSIRVLSGEKVTLLVEDEGAGFNVEAVLATHASTGLSGMRERVHLLGGQFNIESFPGKGTTLLAELPVSQGDSASSPGV